MNGPNSALANGQVASLQSMRPLATTASTIANGPTVQTVVTSAKPAEKTVISTKSLSELLNDIDPNLQLDQETVDALSQVAEEFIEKVTTKACKLAQHRKSNALDAKDVKFFLERDWDVPVPGFPVDEKTWKRTYTTEAHKQRMGLINKQIKKM